MGISLSDTYTENGVYNDAGDSEADDNNDAVGSSLDVLLDLGGGGGGLEAGGGWPSLCYSFLTLLVEILQV